MLSEKIRAGRIEKGLSQQEFADSLSVVRQTVSKWEKGLSVPDSEMLLKISEVLGISVSTLLCEEDPEEDKSAAEKTEEVLDNAAENGTKKHKRSMSPLTIILLILGSPVWLSLLIAAAAVLIALIISLWAVIISFWAIFAAFIGSALGFTVGGGALFFTGSPAAGAVLFAAGLVLAGLSVFSFFGCKAATKGSAWLTEKSVLGIIKCFLKGGKRDE